MVYTLVCHAYVKDDPKAIDGILRMAQYYIKKR